jgi:hypothetical protein
MGWLLVAALMIAVSAATPARAQGSHIIGGVYAACSYAANLEEAQAALLSNDAKWLARVPGCFSPPIGARVGVISRSGAFWKVRIFYPNGQSQIAWVDSQGVRSLDGRDGHLRR